MVQERKNPGHTPVRAVPIASGLWWGVHLVRAGQEVEALQCLLCVRVLAGVHAGGWQRGRRLFSQDLQKRKAVFNNKEWDNLSWTWLFYFIFFLTVLDSTLVLSRPSPSSSSSSSLNSAAAFSMNLKASSTALVSESSAFLLGKSYLCITFK